MQHKHIFLDQACKFFLILVSKFFLSSFCHFLFVHASLIVSLWMVRGNTRETSTFRTRKMSWEGFQLWSPSICLKAGSLVFAVMESSQLPQTSSESPHYNSLQSLL